MDAKLNYIKLLEAYLCIHLHCLSASQPIRERFLVRQIGGTVFAPLLRSSHKNIHTKGSVEKLTRYTANCSRQDFQFSLRKAFMSHESSKWKVTLWLLLLLLLFWGNWRVCNDNSGARRVSVLKALRKIYSPRFLANNLRRTCENNWKIEKSW